MLFLGTFLGGDIMSIPCTPTECADITRIELKDGKYDNLYITKNVTDDLSPTFPDRWDFDTIFYAKFENANAGNVDWSLETVSHVLVKRREINDFKWHVIKVQEIFKKEDFNFQGSDYTNAAKTEYEYAVVPSFHGIDGNYDSMSIYSDFDGVFLVSKNGVVHTSLTNGYCDVTKNAPRSTTITIHSKFPKRIKNTKANYLTGSFSGSFVAYSDMDEEYIVEDKQRSGYQKKVMEFIADGEPKLLKHFDSRVYLINVDETVQNNANGHWQNRDIAFNFTEVGDPDNEKDLYDTELSDVTEEWWQIV